MPALQHESAPDDLTDGNSRRCILTGTRADPDSLIRLVQAPDGAVVPDLARKLPGRGAWIAPDRPQLETAARTPKLKGLLARGWKVDAGSIKGTEALAGLIDRGLLRRAHDRLGLEKRAGNILLGFDAIRDALMRDRVLALIHASDAAADGRAKLANKNSGDDLPCALTRDELSLALGRENVVHAAVTDPGAASRLAGVLRCLWVWRRSATGSAPISEPIETRRD